MATKMVPGYTLVFNMFLSNDDMTIPNPRGRFLRRGRFKIIHNGRPVWTASSTTSGAPNAQGAADQSLKGLGLIPSCRSVGVPHYIVEVNTVYQPNTVGVGGDSFFISSEGNPSGEFTVNGVTRSELLIHRDSNFDTSPGSAGCIVFTNMREWDTFRQNMKGWANAGYTHVKLQVSYS
jgi:hypothetical protein